MNHDDTSFGFGGPVNMVIAAIVDDIMWYSEDELLEYRDRLLDSDDKWAVGQVISLIDARLKNVGVRRRGARERHDWRARVYRLTGLDRAALRAHDLKGGGCPLCGRRNCGDYVRAVNNEAHRRRRGA